MLFEPLLYYTEGGGGRKRFHRKVIVMRSTINVFLIVTSSLMRRSIHELLELDGYNVTGASNYEDALLAVQQSLLDVIVVDLVEPDFTDEMVGNLFAKTLGNPTTIVMREPKLQLAGSPVAARPEVEADFVFYKPVDFDALRSMVRNVVYRRTLLGDRAKFGLLADPAGSESSPL